jgi:mannan endo-1,4-beta-mannosidase
MKANFFQIVTLSLFTSLSALAQIDTDATRKTKALYGNLKIIQNSNAFLFGQEFFNSFRFSSGAAHGEENYSDSKAITGSHPAVLGSDFHYYLEKDATERGYHTDAVKWAYQQGYVVTFDWHISARGTSSYQFAGSPANLVSNIVNNVNGDRTWLYNELDKIIKIINEDLVVNGDTIPIVFRPWHEMNGGWFWWGSSGATETNYKALYALTVDYMKPRTRSVLFCWSPNTPFMLSRYPGDEYVDVVGIDAYEVTVSSLRTQVGQVVDYAQAHNKVAVFSETGDRNSDATAGLYWKNVVLPGIIEDPTGKASKIAWVLTWINASWSEPYVPHSGSSQTVQQSFKSFKNSEAVVFGDEISNIYQPMEVQVGVESKDRQKSDDLLAYVSAGDKSITVQLRHFRKPVTVTLYDLTGRLLKQSVSSDAETELNISLKQGIYILRASDNKVSVSKKIYINQTSGRDH